jgi:16S rRNA (cytidine1402-2'-O)-methyltransferase
MKCLEDIKNIIGEDTQIFIARELTKKFEQCYSGSIVEVQAELTVQFPKDVQGEFVLVFTKPSS